MRVIYIIRQRFMPLLPIRLRYDAATAVWLRRRYYVYMLTLKGERAR